MRRWVQWPLSHRCSTQTSITRTSKQNIPFGTIESNKFQNCGVNYLPIKDNHFFRRRAKIVRRIAFKRLSRKHSVPAKKFERFRSLPLPSKMLTMNVNGSTCRRPDNNNRSNINNRRYTNRDRLLLKRRQWAPYLPEPTLCVHLLFIIYRNRRREWERTIVQRLKARLR